MDEAKEKLYLNIHLLAEVFKRDVFAVSLDGDQVTINTGFVLNIHELVHRCKKWAYDIGYIIKTEPYSVTVESPKFETEFLVKVNGDTSREPYFPGNDLEACVYVLAKERSLRE